MSEQTLIDRWFLPLAKFGSGVDTGIGDDAAVLDVPSGQQLVTSIDTLVEGRHFLPGTDPRLIGHKSLAVNLSDMAAMGATPRWATLALTLPVADADWHNGFVAGFAAGFAGLAKRFDLPLVGGDLSSGPLTISIQIIGTVQTGMAMKRSTAVLDDQVWVSGELGLANQALQARLQARLQAHFQGEDHPGAEALDAPEPRIELGLALQGIASAAIDLSDGLLKDLGRLATASDLSAEINVDQVPGAKDDLVAALSGGDDYELCFTAAANRADEIIALSGQLNLQLTCIGSMTAGGGLICRRGDGSLYLPARTGFDHFDND